MSNPSGVPIRAFIFDWAGTMVDFGSIAPVRAMQDVFAKAGVPISEGEVRASMGKAKRDHIQEILAIPAVGSRWESKRGAKPGEADVDALMAALEPSLTEAAAKHSTLIPGALEAVRFLREQGVGIGSTTGYTRTMMSGILGKAAAAGYEPDIIVCAGETKEGRPSPLMIWKILVELGVWPAAACVKVDDAPVGIEAGRNAGTWTIGVTASGNGVGLSGNAFMGLDAKARRAVLKPAIQAMIAAQADYVIDTVADIPSLYDELCRRIQRGEKPGAECRVLAGR